MKDQIVTFKTAKLAKEKGFDIKSKYWYDMASLGGILIEEGSMYDKETYNTYKKECAMYAPTQSLLQKWLREIHDITIWFSDWEIKEYSVHICQKEETKYMPNKSLGTYEQALEKGLQEALKLINDINQN